MRYSRLTFVILVALILGATTFGFAQETAAPVQASPDHQVVTFKPQYMPPNEVIRFLGTNSSGGMEVFRWRGPDGLHAVEIRSNDAANLLVISGTASDIDHVMSLMKQADIPPRQIEIEVKIVEISTSKAQDLGLDWHSLLESGRASSGRAPILNMYYNRVSEKSESDYSPPTTRIRTSKGISTDTKVEVADVVRILDESGAATVRTAPRILTLNNRAAQILDGQRVTYVTRYGSYTNLYETDSMDAGLNLSVQPSLGESGYLTMRIVAELTSLAIDYRTSGTYPTYPTYVTVGGSPIKEGQMLENTIVVRDGESILLGGMSRSVEEKSRKRFPLLGHVLPFLFSREVTNRDQIESFIVLTPHVVDLGAGLDDKTKAALEPPGTK